MMDVFEQYVGKKVYVRLKSGRAYSGVVKDVKSDANGLCFISITDVKWRPVTFVSSEIEVIQEEG